MKKCICYGSYVIPALVIALFFNPVRTKSQTYELFWEISGNGLKEPSWLLGSMHVTDERVFRLPDSVYLALDKSSIFATEIHPDSLSQILYTSLKDKKVSDAIQKRLDQTEERKRFAAYKKRGGIPLEKVARDKSWALIRLISSKLYCGDNSMPVFLDAWLGGIAQDHGKRIEGLETTKGHFRLSTDTAIANAAEKFNDYTIQLTFHEAYMEHMIALYSTGDLKTMNLLYEHEEPYFHKVMQLRNADMAASMERLMREGSTFTVAGSFHLCGEHSLIALLRERGYKVRPVKYTFSYPEHNFPFVSPVVQREGFLFRDTLSGYEIMFPSEPGLVLLGAGERTKQFAHEVFQDVSYESVARILPEKSEEFEKGLPASVFESATANGLSFIRMDSVITDTLKTYQFVMRNPDNHTREEILEVYKKGINYTLSARYHDTYDGHPEITRFFKSFRMIPQRKAGFTRIPFPVSGITATMPASAGISRTLIEKEGYMVPLTMATAEHKETGEMYIVQVHEFPQGHFIENDSVYLNEFQQRLAEKSRLGELVSRRDTTLFGYPAVVVRLRNPEVLTMEVSCFLRGDATITMIYGMEEKKNKGKRFSPPPPESVLTMQPLQLSAPELYTNRRAGFSCRVPGEMTLVVSDTIPSHSVIGSTGIVSVEEYSVRDSLSAVQYSVTHIRLSPYACYKNRDSLISVLKEILYTEEDFTEPSFRVLPETGSGLFEYSGKMRHSKKMLEGKTLAEENQIVSFTCIYPAELADRSPAQDFFQSYVSDSPGDMHQLYVSKLEGLLKDIQKTERTDKEDFSNMLTDYPVTPADLGLLRAEVQKVQPGEDSSDYFLRESLFQLWSQCDDPGAVKFADSLLPSLPPTLRAALLSSLPYCKAPDAMKGFTDLLLRELRDSADIFNGHQEIFSRFDEDPELLKEITGALLAETGFTYLQRHFLPVLTMAIDSGALEPSVVLPCRSGIQKEVQAVNYKSIRDIHSYYRFLQMNRLLTRLPIDATSEKILLKTLSTGPKYLEPEILAGLLAAGKEVSPAQISKVAADPYQTLRLHEHFSERNLMKHFPREFLTQEHFARAVFFSWMEGDVVPEKTRTLGKLEVTEEGKKVCYWFYQAKYSGSPGYMAGFSGPFSTDESDLNTEDATADLLWDTEYKKQSLKELYRLFLEQIESYENE